ncbi:germination protein YpeB [Clostridium sp. CAG:1024]|nr:germination protein YpeB [Clostridium sp. CAG:1024]
MTSETYFESALAAEGENGGTQEANLSHYPTLIYDGPFSDSTEKAEPLGLPEETVDAETALARASESLGGASLTPDGETLGSIETYDFSGTDAAGRSVEISITKRGGCVLTMMKTPEGAAEGKPEDAEVERYKAAAADYLSAQGYPAMTSSYAQYYAGIAVFNFAAEQGGVVLYPDLVKVYVERQSAEVVGLDARSYFFSHRERALPIPALTEEDARNAVSGGKKRRVRPAHDRNGAARAHPENARDGGSVLRMHRQIRQRGVRGIHQRPKRRGRTAL